MKKTKLLTPILGLASIGSIVVPAVTLSSCSRPATNLFNIVNRDGKKILMGFADGATDEQILDKFGDTLVIPKDVDEINQKAFINEDATNIRLSTSTIPTGIRKFKFEDEYKCEKIGDYAFYGAPFESVEMSCERIDGWDPTKPERECWWRPVIGWGIKKIGKYAFFQTINLKTVKLCATINEISQEDPTFGYYEDPGIAEPVIKTNVNTIDLSDWLFDANSQPGTRPDNFDGIDLSTIFHINFNTDTTQNGRIIVRAYIGADSPAGSDRDSINITYNSYRTALGVNPISTVSQPVVYPLFENSSWSFVPRYNKVDTFGNLEIEGKNIPCLMNKYTVLSYTYKSYFTTSGVVGYRYDFDLTKWAGQIPTEWAITMAAKGKILREEASDIEIKVIDKVGNEATWNYGADYKIDSRGKIVPMPGRVLTKNIATIRLQFRNIGGTALVNPGHIFFADQKLIPW